MIEQEWKLRSDDELVLNFFLFFLGFNFRQPVSCVFTFQKLFTSVLLEEGLVDDGTSEVVNHQVDNRLNLLLVISSVVCQNLVLLWEEKML